MPWIPNTHIATSAATANGRSAFVPSPNDDSPISYTYTYTSAPADGDGSLNILNNGKAGLGGLISLDSNPYWTGYDSLVRTTQWLHWYEPYFSWPALWNADDRAHWSGSDMVQVADLGSAQTVDHIVIYGVHHQGSSVSPPSGFKVRSADDSSISTGVATAFSDFTSLSGFENNNMPWVAILDVSAAAAKRYWEVTVHRTGTHIYVTEVVFCATAA